MTSGDPLRIGIFTDDFGPEPGEPALVSRDWHSLARLASAIDRFTSPAAYLVDGVVAASGGALAERGHVAASGVGEAFRRARRKRGRDSVTRFLSAGRLAAEKRVDVLLDAFEALVRDDAELHIIGTGGAPPGSPTARSASSATSPTPICSPRSWPMPTCSG